MPSKAAARKYARLHCAEREHCSLLAQLERSLAGRTELKLNRKSVFFFCKRASRVLAPFGGKGKLDGREYTWAAMRLEG